MKYKIIVELNDEEKSELKAAVENHPLDYEQDQWQKMTEAEVKDAVVYCIASTQSRYEAVEKFDHANKDRHLWALSEPEIEKLLRDYGIRFPNKKAKWIAALAKAEIKGAIKKAFTKSQPTDLQSSRRARSILKHELSIKGLGDKQMSHLLTKWLGFTPWLVPLDSRWDNFLRIRGFFQEFDDPRYVLLEDLSIALASELGVKPAELDQAIWEMMG